MVGVSWYEAVAYCKWLTRTLRDRGQLDKDEVVRLPTEAEWEKAARGEHGREWPWGDEWDESKCNNSEGALGHTSPVGHYSPAGDRPYGCADMAGNVWQWCGTKWVGSYRDYDRKAEDREEPEGDVPRVLRGGSWDADRRHVRCASRNGSDRHARYARVGFRVVLVGAACLSSGLTPWVSGPPEMRRGCGFAAEAQ